MPIRAGHIVTVEDFDVFGVVAYKSGDESVTSSATLQNDDVLVLPVVANARYIMDSQFFYTGAGDGATGGFKIGWTGPSGATMLWANYGTTQNLSPTLVNYNVVVESIGGGRGVGTNGATVMSCVPKGVLNTGANSGSLQLQWAQGGSNATATVLKAGSWIRLTRIA